MLSTYDSCVVCIVSAKPLLGSGNCLYVYFFLEMNKGAGGSCINKRLLL